VSFAAVVERLQKLENPYPGLRPFDVGESHLFFGRDLQVAELVRRLERYRFVAVLGMSGSGKSSLVRAGLLPALERGGVWAAGRRWRRIVMQPAGAPFENLQRELEKSGLSASSLRESSHGLIKVARQLPADESLLVVVDQFEELFRYKDLRTIGEEARRSRDRQAADAAEFVQLLLEASRHHPPIYIVITMRSDYVGDCAEFRDLPETLNDCQYLVPRMTREQRKEAIEGPLGRVEIAASLVQRLLNDVGDAPDQLPVLQHALMRTWSQWRQADPQQTRRIELQDYEAVGGFDGALNRHADELLAMVPADIAACVFKRLTARGRGDRERRDPAPLSELWAVCGAVTPEGRAQVTAVIDRFRSGDATFLRPLTGALGPDTYVDITHESLIRLWKKLRDEWLPEEQVSAKALFDVAERARNWRAGTGELLTGLDLVRVDDWDRTRNRTAAWAQHYVDEATDRDVRDFVAASRVKQRRRRIVKIVLWCAAVGIVVVVAGWMAHDAIQAQREAATEARKELKEKVYELETANEQELARAQTEAALRAPAPSLSVSPTAPAPSPSPEASKASGPPASELAPRVYIQVRRQAELARVRELTGALQKAGFVVPRPEVLDTGPTATEVRYFRAAERDAAAEILRTLQQAGERSARMLYVTGFEDSTRIRPKHFEIWLAPADVLRTLVRQLDDDSEGVRKTAGGRLARDHRANPEAIGLVLDTLSETNLASLSTSGRINALYFLNRSESSAWTGEHKQLARQAIERMRSRDWASKLALGPQATQELNSLEQKVAGK
jgi:hypothetical protein